MQSQRSTDHLRVGVLVIFWKTDSNFIFYFTSFHQHSFFNQFFLCNNEITKIFIQKIYIYAMCVMCCMCCVSCVVSIQYLVYIMCCINTVSCIYHVYIVYVYTICSMYIVCIYYVYLLLILYNYTQTIHILLI